MRIEFSVPALPVAQPRPRFARAGQFVRTYAAASNHPVHAYKATLRMAAQQAYQGPPLQGRVRVDLVFLFPRPGRLVWKKRPMPRCEHVAKPDRDSQREHRVIVFR